MVTNPEEELLEIDSGVDPSCLVAAFPPSEYFRSGYFTFTRSRRLRWAWPLAIACTLTVQFAIELIWSYE